MNVVVVGSGGREHALAHKIKESSQLDKLFLIPGNPGTQFLGDNITINPSDQIKIVEFCKEKKIDLVVIGPEQPLVEGLANILRENQINVFGPNKEAAQIESSKYFAKQVMKEAGVPTAKYLPFTSKMLEPAREYIKNKKYPCVIKADGLAAGKGVFVCNEPKEAEDALKLIFHDKVFGESGEKVLVEEFLVGEEVSVFAIAKKCQYLLFLMVTNLYVYPHLRITKGLEIMIQVKILEEWVPTLRHLLLLLKCLKKLKAKFSILSLKL